MVILHALNVKNNQVITDLKKMDIVPSVIYNGCYHISAASIKQ